MPYDANATRTRIFDAAATEFAVHGIAGARMDRIATAAKANKASIYAYFGDKETLFAAVLRRQLGEMADAVEVDPGSVPEYVGELFDYQVNHPEVVRLVQHEALNFGNQGVPWDAQDPRSAHYAHKADAVAQAQINGLVDASLNPRNVVLAMLGMVSWYTAAPQISRLLIGDPADTTTIASHRATLVELAHRMLAP